MRLGNHSYGLTDLLVLVRGLALVLVLPAIAIVAAVMAVALAAMVLDSGGFSVACQAVFTQNSC